MPREVLAGSLDAPLSLLVAQWLLLNCVVGSSVGDCCVFELYIWHDDSAVSCNLQNMRTQALQLGHDLKCTPCPMNTRSILFKPFRYKYAFVAIRCISAIHYHTMSESSATQRWRQSTPQL